MATSQECLKIIGFHSQENKELNYWRYGKTQINLKKKVIIQERKAGYRFYLHQHPYIKQLTQRLLREGTSGLQASDTNYRKEPDGSFETLPDGKFKPVLFA